MNNQNKEPEKIEGSVDRYVKNLLGHTRDKSERAQLILFDIVQHMAKGSYIFAKLKGIAKDLAKENATYTIKERYVECRKKCIKCPHGPYYYLYYRIGIKQNSRYLGKPLWQHK